MPIRIKGPTADRHPRRKWDSPERRKERQKEYMDKHGPQQPRRKRLATTDPHKKIRDQRKFSEAGFKDLRVAKATGSSVGKTKGPKGTGYKPKWPPKGWQDRGMGKKFPRPKENLIEKLGGSEKAKPHSTKEGRVASGERRIRRMLKPKHVKPTPTPQYIKPLPKWKRQPYKVPAKRAKHGIGSLVKGAKKIITKLKPKPKPKVDDIDKPFKGYDKSYTRADDKKITSMLKKLGDEIKAAPLPPKLKATLKKAQEASPHKKAEGGRIGLKKGSVHKPGSHSWYLQHMNRTKKASGGRANFRDGGSVGAAVRGHGAEIK